MKVNVIFNRTPRLRKLAQISYKVFYINDL